MIIKNIEIDGMQVPFRASASIPRLYRSAFRRDIFKDLSKMKESMENAKEEGEDMPISDLEMFENVAYIMAKHADKKQPDTPEEWLDQFNTFSIYEVLPELISLWGMNEEQKIESKKNLDKVRGN